MSWSINISSILFGCTIVLLIVMLMVVIGEKRLWQGFSLVDCRDPQDGGEVAGCLQDEINDEWVLYMSK